MSHVWGIRSASSVRSWAPLAFLVFAIASLAGPAWAQTTCAASAEPTLLEPADGNVYLYSTLRVQIEIDAGEVLQGLRSVDFDEIKYAPDCSFNLAGNIDLCSLEAPPGIEYVPGSVSNPTDPGRACMTESNTPVTWTADDSDPRVVVFSAAPEVSLDRGDICTFEFDVRVVDSSQVDAPNRFDGFTFFTGVCVDDNGDPAELAAQTSTLVLPLLADCTADIVKEVFCNGQWVDDCAYPEGSTVQWRIRAINRRVCETTRDQFCEMDSQCPGTERCVALQPISGCEIDDSDLDLAGCAPVTSPLGGPVCAGTSQPCVSDDDCPGDVCVAAEYVCEVQDVCMDITNTAFLDCQACEGEPAGTPRRRRVCNQDDQLACNTDTDCGNAGPCVNTRWANTALPTSDTASVTCDSILAPPCRVTQGGNINKGPGTNRYDFGGQAGAPTANQPQPYGEWTHHNRNGPDGSFVFHGGTASSPEATEIIEIVCSDPGFCNPARPAPAKQIDIRGIGTFNNISNPSPPLSGVIAQETHHYFTVHVEDLGEPGSHGLENTEECPPEGSFGELASCECRDFYHIVIYKEFDPATEEPKTDPADVIYEEFGYLDGGNMQLHPPID